MAVVKAGLIQMSLKGDVERDTAEQISEKMIAAHLPLIEQAAQEGVQVLGLQELFNLPYVGAEQDRRWYRATERVPDGPTVQRMRAEAARLGMALVVPVYEEAQTGVYYNHRRRDRRGRALPRQVPQDSHSPRRGLSARSSTSSPATSAIRCSRPRSAGSESTSATTGTSPKAGASSP